MKRILFLTALGIFLPSFVAAQQCTWVCDDGSDGTAPSYQQTLRLSELLPNPAGDDTQGEFIELENSSDVAHELAGWKLVDGSGRTYTFKEGTMPAKGFFSVKRTVSKISLNNTDAEIVSLLSPDGKVQDEAEYEGTAAEGVSYARQGTYWVWSTTVTEGRANIITVLNAVPELEVIIPEQVFAHQETLFSAETSSDADGDPLSFVWQFSDGTTAEGARVAKTYDVSGDFSVLVTAQDTKGGSTAEEFVFSVLPFDLSAFVVLNEVHPKPESGQEEFIELGNSGDVRVELGGWQLTDGSRVFTFPHDATIAAHSFVVVYKTESGIALNDTGDTVQLSRPDESVADTVTYTSAQKGMSYGRTDSGWAWISPSPAAANQGQEEGVVLGAITEGMSHEHTTPLSAQKGFFENYGIMLLGIGTAGVVGFSLFRKWKRDKEEQEDYDIV